ncbi:MAG: endonuclease Q family protein [bacterium]
MTDAGKSFVADLHIHSYLSRATSKQCDLPHLALWAQRKGIRLLATGDFTHPEWFARIEEELVPGDNGFFRLRPDLTREVAAQVPAACRSTVDFVLQVEISSIYKRAGAVRKVHNLVYMPDLEAARKLGEALGRIGNIGSDGRPILGLDSRDLLEIVLGCSDRAALIPAHVWTPWFSVFGSKSGFDSLEECYGDLTDHIFAVETGLSSDPPMNWRLSLLDGLTLVSNSDAHSPAKLGREANLFHTAVAYDDVFDALRSGDPKRCGGTLEFYPEEGKYHLDGCRRCGVRLLPDETRGIGGRCPECGKKITVGVLSRVDELADRAPGARPDSALEFSSLVPLQEVLGECFRQGPATKRVQREYDRLLGELGPELTILRALPVEALRCASTPLLGEAIRRVRAGELHIQAGYDGEFGQVGIFGSDERDRLLGQADLFPVPALPPPVARRADPGAVVPEPGGAAPPVR